MLNIMNDSNADSLLDSLFSQTIENLKSCVFVIEIYSRKIIYVNQYFKEQYHDMVGLYVNQEANNASNPIMDYCESAGLFEKSKENKIVDPPVFHCKGTNRWFEIQVQSLKPHKGQLFRLFIATDITSYKLTDLENKNLSRAVSQSAESIVITDGQGHIQYVNPAFEALTGYSKEEVIGRTPRLLKSGQLADDFYRVLWEQISAGNFFQADFINQKKDGSNYYERKTISPVKNENGSIINYISVGQDITEKKRIEEEIAKKEEMVSKIINTIPIPLTVSRLDDGAAIFVNDPFFEQFGFDREDIHKYKSTDIYFDPDERKIILENIYKHGFLHNYELRLKRKDGNLFWAIISADLIQINDQDAVITGFYNITDRKQVEKEIIEKNYFLQTLLDAIPTPVFYKDEQGIYLGCNKAFEKMLGLTKEKIIGKTVYEISPSELAKQYHDKDFELFHQLGSQIYESSIIHKDGTKREVIFYKSTFMKPDGAVGGIIGNIIDVSQSKKLERELKKKNRILKQKNREQQETLDKLKEMQNQIIHQEKMAFLGNMTTGIAHELKNPLNFINNFSLIALELLNETSEENKAKTNSDNPYQLYHNQKRINLINNLEKILEHGQRADQIIQRMLLHSKVASGKFSKTNINAMLNNTVKFVLNGIQIKNPDVSFNISYNYDNSIGMINISAQDISRVFLNLIENSFYTLLNKVKSYPNYQPELFISTLDKKKWIEIRIWDNGEGIAEKHLKKLFTPFFTTKPSGEGTGLGLSISYDIIVHIHRGSIKVNTKEGEYSEFIISLPKQ